MSVGRCPICGRIIYGGENPAEVALQLIDDEENGSTISDQCGLEYQWIDIDGMSKDECLWLIQEQRRIYWANNPI